MIKKIQDNVLYFDGCSTVELAEKYGTPLYVISETEIVDRFEQLKRDFFVQVPRYQSGICV